MKILLALVSLCLGLRWGHAQARGISDPLRDYYLHNQEDMDGPLPPETEVYYFKADFTGNGRRSFFITSKAAGLGNHRSYAWMVYYPLASGKYRLLTDGSNFVDAGEPAYIGYIKQIKRYGIVVVDRVVIVAYYLDKGHLQSQAIEHERAHIGAEFYPEYFSDSVPENHVVTTTMGRLARKYAR